MACLNKYILVEETPTICGPSWPYVLSQNWMYWPTWHNGAALMLIAVEFQPPAFFLGKHLVLMLLEEP